MTISPIANSSYKGSAEAGLFLQANEEAFRQLVTFLDFAPEKFTICFVSVNFAEDRAAIIEALQQHPDCQQMQFVQFEFADPQLQFLQEELIEKLPQIAREADKKLVLLLTGLEASIRMVGDLGDYPPMLVDLNYVRDGFTTNVPYPIVIFLPDKALSRLAEFAPDFWAWRMAVIRFESLADDVKLRVQPFIRRDDTAELAETKDTFDRVLDSRAKRDMIPRFLMEYESGSLAQDNDKSIKYELMADLGISLYDGDDLDIAKDTLRKSLEIEHFEETKISRPKAQCYLGMIDRRQENYESAIERLNQSISEFEGLEDEQYPDFKEDFAKADANRGFTYLLVERYSEALVDFTRAIELDPDYKGAIALRGETYRLMERYPEALIDFTRAIELNPEDKRVIAQRGFTYQLMERYPEALIDFTCAIELDLEDKRVIAQRGKTYQLMERYPEALVDFTQAIELDPEDKRVIAQRGKTYRLMERYPEALVDFTRAIELDPRDKWAIAQRGETYRLMERYLEALVDFTRVIELDPDYKWAITKRGDTYQLMERYLEALVDFTRAIELDPEDKRAITKRGDTYQLMERYLEALVDFTRAIELDPEDKRAITNRGETYQLMERYPEALVDFTRAIELDQEDEWAITNRGYTYQLMERYPEALVDFTRAIELDQEDEWAITQRGTTYRLMERYPEALVDFTRAIELDPDYKWAIHQERSEMYLLLGKYKQALQDLNQSLQIDADSDWRLYMRSLAYTALKQIENAKTDIGKAIQLAQQTYETKPQNWYNIFNLAIYHLTAGEIEQTKHLYQDALRKDPSIRLIKEAIRDLKDLLTVLPDYPHAEELRSYLQAALASRTE